MEVKFLVYCLIVILTTFNSGLPCGEDGDIRLAGGSSELNGRVEICYHGVWGTVCDDSWDDREAVVVCRQLGHTTPGARSIINEFEPGSGPIHLDEVHCRGNEEYLVNCSNDGFSEHDCTHSEDAGVNCEGFSCANGDVKLVEGYSKYDGRVEVCVNDSYVTICDDDSWEIEEAIVVCQQLNFTGPSGNAPILVFGGMYPFGEASQSLSNLQCTGLEPNLYSCPHTSTSLCVTAGVLCPRPDPLCSDYEVRLTGERPNEGRVEICINGHWSGVCHDGWGRLEAEVVCRQFGYSGEGAISVGVGEFGPEDGLVLLTNMSCNGSENSLTLCFHDNITENSCSHFQDAGVICTDPNSTCIHGEMRLVDGRSSNEGRLEICFNNHWGTVCDDGFHSQEASLVCRELGFSREGAVSLHSAHFGPGSGLILVDEVECRGNESTLLECSHLGIGISDCSHREDISILCQSKNASCINGDVRLQNGTGPHSGRVEFCFSGQWGTVCDDGWGREDATVVCNQLNYTGASIGLSGSFFGPGSGPIFLDDVECLASKHNRLIECFGSEEHLGRHNCDHSEDAAVICSIDSSVCGNVSNGGIRLVGGASELEGRVELCLDGQWGTICDSFWSNYDAEVVCQQLSFSKLNAVAVRRGEFGAGSGPIHLNNLFCLGGEEILTDCSHSFGHHCNHVQDAGVRCSGRCADGEVRLVGGLVPSHGRVEICIHENFGTVCDDGWDAPDARVVCRQLGFNRAEPVRNGFFGTATLPSFLSMLGCAGNENSLMECTSLSPSEACPPNRIAGVICYA